MAATATKQVAARSQGVAVHRSCPIASPRPTVVRARCQAKASDREEMPAGSRRAMLVGLAAGAGSAALSSISVPAAHAGPDPIAVQVVKQVYTAYKQSKISGDNKALLAMFADDVDWESNAGGGFRGRGKAAVVQYFKWLDKAVEIQTFKPLKIMADFDGDEVTSVIDWRGQGKLTGKPFSTQTVHWFKIDAKARKIKSHREFTDPAEYGPAITGQLKVMDV